MKSRYVDLTFQAVFVVSVLAFHLLGHELTNAAIWSFGEEVHRMQGALIMAQASLAILVVILIDKHGAWWFLGFLMLFNIRNWWLLAQYSEGYFGWYYLPLTAILVETAAFLMRLNGFTMCRSKNSPCDKTPKFSLESMLFLIALAAILTHMARSVQEYALANYLISVSNALITLLAFWCVLSPVRLWWRIGAAVCGIVPLTAAPFILSNMWDSYAKAWQLNCVAYIYYFGIVSGSLLAFRFCGYRLRDSNNSIVDGSSMSGKEASACGSFAEPMARS